MKVILENKYQWIEALKFIENLSNICRKFVEILEKYLEYKLLIPSHDQDLLHMLFQCISGRLGYFNSGMSQYVDELK